MKAGGTGLSVMGKVSVTPEVMDKYEKAMRELVRHLKKKGVDMKSDPDIDAGVTDFTNMKFCVGEEAFFRDRLSGPSCRRTVASERSRCHECCAPAKDGAAWPRVDRAGHFHGRWSRGSPWSSCG